MLEGDVVVGVEEGLEIVVFFIVEDIGVGFGEMVVGDIVGGVLGGLVVGGIIIVGGIVVVIEFVD